MGRDDLTRTGALALPDTVPEQTMKSAARVLFVDDHDPRVGALAKLLEPHFTVVGTVSDRYSLFEKAIDLKPDVVVIDVATPKLNAVETGKKLKSMFPATKLVVVAVNEQPEIASQALRNWASGYLLKKSAASELVQAIREVLKGGTYVTPWMAQHLGSKFVRDPSAGHVTKLSPRQREVLQLLAEGNNMRQAAKILGISARTVAFHKYRIMEEFNLKSITDLVRLAIREQMVSLS